MQTTFSELVQIEGVLGFALLGSTGECLIHGLQSPYEPALLEEVFARIQTIVALAPSIHEAAHNFDSFTVRGTEHYVLVRGVAGGYLLVLSAASVNLSMVNVALRVAAIKLERGGPQLDSARSHRGTALSSSAAISARAGRAATPLPDSSQRAEYRTAPSLAHSSALPADPPLRTRSSPSVGENGLARNMLELLAQRIGPYARVLIKLELRTMGVEPHSLTSAHLEDLALRLASKIPDAAERATFLKQVGALQSRDPETT